MESQGADVLASWQRSAGDYRIDPQAHQPPRVLTSQELAAARAPVEELVAFAREDNDRLFAAVGKVGYALLFAAADGVVVDARGDPNRVAQFQHWGIWQGGVWSEAVEGTNGIGTSIAERRPITVHRAQHYRVRHAPLSCSSAPVFDEAGRLVAVLDVSSYEPPVSDRSHGLALALTIDTARAIEERLFRSRFLRAWIIALAVPPPGETRLLLAVDDDQRIVGADRHARELLRLDDATLEHRASLWQYFERLPAAFAPQDADRELELSRPGDAARWPALMTAPLGRVAPSYAHYHARARLWRATPPANGAGSLTPRERRILALVAAGHSNKEVGHILGISPETVKTHLERVFAKLGVQRRAQAISHAKALGLLA